jgi:hypothetical protein
MAKKLASKRCRAVGHRELASALRAEFPQTCINVSPVAGGRPGECYLSVTGDDSDLVRERAQVLACVAVLLNQATMFGAPLGAHRWSEYAVCCVVRRTASCTSLVMRRDGARARFLLEPAGRAGRARRRLRLYLREL